MARNDISHLAEKSVIGEDGEGGMDLSLLVEQFLKMVTRMSRVVKKAFGIECKS